MKARGSLLALVCALVALTAAPGATAAALGRSNAGLLGRKLELSTIKLEAPDGYEVEVEGFRFGQAKSGALVKIGGGPLVSTYAVKTEPGPGIHATFAELGALAVSFQRRKRKVLKPEPGCRWITETGVFRGSFQFTGENSYVSVEATDPEGEVFRLPNGFCGLGSFRPGLPDFGLSGMVLAAEGQGAHGVVLFEASRLLKGKRSSFTASLKERVRGMKIERSAQMAAGKQSFAYGGVARAIVTPSAPFTGSAELREPAHQPSSWTGDLAISFLGAPDIPLTGEGFVARLCLHQPILTPCRP